MVGQGEGSGNFCGAQGMGVVVDKAAGSFVEIGAVTSGATARLKGFTPSKEMPHFVFANSERDEPAFTEMQVFPRYMTLPEQVVERLQTAV